MSKVGRNDSCPCMSGEKFKKCCQISGIWDNFKAQDLSFVNEQYFFSDLLASDERFNRLYRADRVRINKPVLCFKADFKMTAAASYGNIGNEAYTILSKHQKLPVSDSIHMAHEIEHLVLHSMGHKGVTHKNREFNTKYRTHKFLNDMLYDPLVNKRLIQYGYDLQKYLNLSDEVQIGLQNISDNELLVKTLYVKRTLDYRNLYAGIAEDDIEFVKWVKIAYPQVVSDSKRILEIVEKYEIELPHQSELALNEVIHYLGLESLLTLDEV